MDAAELDRAVAAVNAGARRLPLETDLGRAGRAARSTPRARRDREAEAEATRLRLARAELRDALPGPLAALGRGARRRSSAPPSGGASVLLTGESGTEKDEAALALHRLSARGAGRFAYISEGESLDLATRQTGAGTLFLPNVEATSTGFQETLAARISTADDRRGSSSRSTRIPPTRSAGAGCCVRSTRRFPDTVVHLPPLREREGDVAIAGRGLPRGSRPRIWASSPTPLDVLRAHDWPGNVIELREVVRRAARLSESAIGPIVVRSVLARPLPRAKQRRRKAPVVRIAVGDSLADVERRMISKTLEFARGNKKKTAELLKLSLKTIYNKIKEYGLEH